MRMIILYRYILSEEKAGKYLVRTICTSPAGQFRWIRYKLYSWNKDSILSCIWRLDGRSVMHIPGIRIIENTAEEAELWETT